jgi:hypothetical protein
MRELPHVHKYNIKEETGICSSVSSTAVWYVVNILVIILALLC